MADLFCQGAERILPALRETLAARQEAELRREAHTLKGSSRDLGGSKLASLCQQLEDRAHREEYEGAEELGEQIEAAFVETREAISSYLGGQT